MHVPVLNLDALGRRPVDDGVGNRGHGLHDVRLEPGAGMGPQFSHRFGRGARRSIRASRRDRVERIRDPHDGGEERDLIALRSVRIAAAVRLLVMQLDNREVVGEEAQRLEDPRAEQRCFLI